MADQLVLVHDERLAALITGLQCYPSGLRFHLQIITRRPDDALDAAIRGGLYPTGDAGRAPASDVLVLAMTATGLGTVETVLLARCVAVASGELNLTPLGGGGGGGEWDLEYWLTPLPLGPGETTFRLRELSGATRDTGGSATMANATLAAAAAKARDLGPADPR